MAVAEDHQTSSGHAKETHGKMLVFAAHADLPNPADRNWVSNLSLIIATALLPVTSLCELCLNSRWDAWIQRSLQLVLTVSMLQHTPLVIQILVTSEHEQSLYLPSIHRAAHTSEEKG